jgi:hypothetical protein
MRARRQLYWAVCWSLSGAWGTAQPANPDPATPLTSVRSARSLPPMPVSPIERFRQLLALNAEDVEQALARTPNAQRAALKAKLQEYKSLSAHDRELRLRVTELRWIVPRWKELSPTNRAEFLRTVPPDYRAEIEAGLNQWNQLPPDAQRDALENQWTIPYILQLEASTPAGDETGRGGLSPEVRARLEPRMAEWRALPPDRRQRICDRVQQFFELTPQEKQKTLNALTEAERKQMERTLQAFEQLPPSQRRACINSFGRFAGLTPGEQAQFLRNADRWNSMSPADREVWRKLVTQLPPMPPGAGQPPLPSPVIRGFKPPPPPLPFVATNAGNPDRH